MKFNVAIIIKLFFCNNLDGSNDMVDVIPSEYTYNIKLICITDFVICSFSHAIDWEEPTSILILYLNLRFEFSYHF